MSIQENFLQDAEALGNLDGDQELLDSIRIIFLETAEESLAGLSVAVLKAEPQNFLRAVHSLKSSAGSIGAPKLATLSGQIEMLLREDQSGLVGNLIPGLLDCFDCTVKELMLSVNP